MKEDNITQSGDYDAPFREQQYRHGSCYVSLFKFKSFDQFNTPQTASNFGHLLSCGTFASSFSTTGNQLFGKKHWLSFYFLQVYMYESLHKFSCLDWQFYLILTRLLAKFELSAKTANETCFNFQFSTE